MTESGDGDSLRIHIQNIGGIYVDRFIVAPGSAVTESLYEKINKNPGSIVFSCTPFNDAWFSMTVDTVPELSISYVSSEYPKNIPDSFQGIVVEYLNGGNVRKAIAFQLGDCGKSFSDSGRMKMKLSEECSIDAELLVLPESKKRWVLNHVAIPVGKNAPPECDSARISLISVGSGSYLNGIFTSPLLNDMKISDLKTGKNMGIVKESLSLIQDKMSTKGIRSLRNSILK